MPLDEYKAELAAQGWCFFSAGERADKNALEAEVASLAEELGEIVLGRNRQRVEHILPQESTRCAPTMSILAEPILHDYIKVAVKRKPNRDHYLHVVPISIVPFESTTQF